VRAVLQRAASGRVTVDERVAGEIGRGLVVLLGVAAGDTVADARWMADKVARLRIFEDEGGKMNVSVLDVGGSILLVSQFTLLASCQKGRRPSFTDAAPPEVGRVLYEEVGDELRARGLSVETGEFGARMLVSIENEGPVTILLDSKAGTSPGEGE
jgi:D-aminoacyl-tRNA deacylase